LYNYDDAIDGRVGTNYYDFYSVSVGHYLLTGKISKKYKNDSLKSSMTNNCVCNVMIVPTH
jgi:hypothetical protein